MEKAVVKNAADKDQVREGKQKELSRRDRELADLRFVLASKEGRRLMWRFIGHCKTFESVCNPSGSITYYNSGKQDVGHYLLAEIGAASEDAFILMMKENKEN